MTSASEKTLLNEIAELKMQLEEANDLIEAIRSGNVDALAINKEGRPDIYTLEGADYTYRILVEKSNEGAITISESGLILFCNERFSRILDVPINKLLGQLLVNFIEENQKLFFLDLVEKAKDHSVRGEVVVKINEKSIPVNLSFNSLRPQLPTIGIIVTDLTQKKKSEQELLEYQSLLQTQLEELNKRNEELGQFAHIISHDLKEPLRKISIYTDLISGTEEENKKYVKVIQNSTDRMRNLIEDVLLYSEETRMDKKTFEECDLNKVLHTILDDLDHVIEERNVIISIGPLPTICASFSQMTQLFSNLISNAIKYCHRDVPEVIIKVENDPNEDQNFHRIIVKDNGIGFDQKYAAKIFAIFQRLHAKDVYSGTGIGLSICKKIVENHKGGISVFSKENEGSTFVVLLPK